MLILPVFCIRGVYRGLICFSLVLILRTPTYLGIKGDQFFSDMGIFLAVVLRTNWCTTIYIMCPISRKIECNKFVCNKFVLVLLQIDIIQCFIPELTCFWVLLDCPNANMLSQHIFPETVSRSKCWATAMISMWSATRPSNTPLYKPALGDVS